VNSGLLCVAGRFEPLFDSRKRVVSPLVRRNGQLEEAGWEEALDAAVAGLRSVDGRHVMGLASTRLTNEAFERLSLFLKGLGAGSMATVPPVSDFLAEPEGSLAALDEADSFVVVGEDLSVDHQVAGMAIRRAVTNRGATLVLVGDGENGFSDLASCNVGRDEIDQAIALVRDAKSPVVVYGAAAGDLLPQLRRALGSKAQFVGLVPGTNSRGALAAGLSGDTNLTGAQAAYVAVADDTVEDSVLAIVEGVGFVVAQTSYAGPIVDHADVVLPAAIWAEKSGTVTNTEGIVQEIHAVLQPPHSVRTDCEILDAVLARLK